MRRTGIFSQYTRAALRSEAGDRLGKSLLAFLATGEAYLILMLVRESRV